MCVVAQASLHLSMSILCGNEEGGCVAARPGIDSSSSTDQGLDDPHMTVGGRIVQRREPDACLQGNLQLYRGVS